MKDKNARKLLEILLTHAPTEVERRLCEKLLRDTALSGSNPELVLAGTLYDGLAYGNWPWGTRA